MQRLRVDTEIHELCRRKLCGVYRLGEYDHPPRAPHGALELAQAFVFSLRLGEQLAAPIEKRQISPRRNGLTLRSVEAQPVDRLHELTERFGRDAERLDEASTGPTHFLVEVLVLRPLLVTERDRHQDDREARHDPLRDGVAVAEAVHHASEVGLDDCLVGDVQTRMRRAKAEPRFELAGQGNAVNLGSATVALVHDEKTRASAEPEAARPRRVDGPHQHITVAQVIATAVTQSTNRNLRQNPAQLPGPLVEQLPSRYHDRRLAASHQLSGDRMESDARLACVGDRLHYPPTIVGGPGLECFPLPSIQTQAHGHRTSSFHLVSRPTRSLRLSHFHTSEYRRRSCALVTSERHSVHVSNEENS